MNYLESVAYIESLAPTILDPDLARFASFMRQHGNLQDKFASIHVAGTNGKGSTVAIVESVLRTAGLRTGRFIGPHLLRWNERFHVNGQPVGDDEFAALCTILREHSEAFGREHPQYGSLTWFEFLTAVGFFWFAQSEVEVAVVEVGLGGRWDSTNVLSNPLATAITTIDYDHMHILGSTLGEIAGEKAGIIKPGVPVVTAVSGLALETIMARVDELGCPVFIVGEFDRPDGVHVEYVESETKQRRSVDLRRFAAAYSESAQAALYQKQNALISYMVLSLVEQRLNKDLIEPHFADGLKRVYWPGRFQYIPDRHLLLDGAHNPAGSRALAAALERSFDSPRCFVLSFFESKNVLAALQSLLRPGDRVFASQAKTHRAVCKAERIVELSAQLGAKAKAVSSISEALQQAEESRRHEELIVATGSFATVKECMLAMGWRTVEDGRGHTAIAR
jgi:dihydrofolate synthase / folylpolyglutamate synthase